MKVTIDLENLSELVQTSIEKSMEETVQEAIETVVREKVDKCLEDETSNTVNDAIRSYVEDYIKETKIQVGNSWDGEGVKEYTVEEYLKMKVANIFEKQLLTTKVKDRWGDYRESTVSFKDYLDNAVNIEASVKAHIEDMAKKVKCEVNNKVKAMFDDSMKSMLTENVFNILSSSDTYRTITRNIQLLGE